MKTLVFTYYLRVPQNKVFVIISYPYMIFYCLENLIQRRANHYFYSISSHIMATLVLLCFLLFRLQRINENFPYYYYQSKQSRQVSLQCAEAIQWNETRIFSPSPVHMADTCVKLVHGDKNGNVLEVCLFVY